MLQQAIFCCLAISYLTTGDFCTFESVLGCRLCTEKDFTPHVGPSGSRLVSADTAMHFNANNVVVIPKPYKWA